MENIDMKRLIFILALLFALSGCAATTNIYGSMYNNAVAQGKSTVIIQDNPLRAIQDRVNAGAESLGYKKVIYSSPEEGFLVIVKEISVAKAFLIGDPHIYKIILKYTKSGPDQTRIDLVNGSTVVWAKNEVSRDIEKLAELIQSVPKR